MSDFTVELRKVDEIIPHPDADAIEIAMIGGFKTIVRKGIWKAGMHGVYIPEHSVVPDNLLERIGLKGKLAGSKKNRVRPVKLRGVLSEGILVTPMEAIPVPHPVAAGHDFAEELGIYKYEPPIPVSMRGEVLNLLGKSMKYDIENIKKYPHTLDENEIVAITEKLHGTFVCMGHDPSLDNRELYMNNIIIHSKGLGAKGLVFKWNAANVGLVYHRAFKTIEKQFLEIRDDGIGPFYLLGEVYGRGVQDLQYGEKDIKVRFFDVYIGEPGKGYYMSPSEKYDFLKQYEIESVPVLYHGIYTPKILEFYCQDVNEGNEILSGHSCNVREGVVVTPEIERVDPVLGRVILKSINPRYYDRKGEKTEFN